MAVFLSMINGMRRFATLLFVFAFTFVQAQETAADIDLSNVPLIRQFFYENIKTAQLYICALDGKKDDALDCTAEVATNQKATYAIINQVNQIKLEIEADSTLDNNEKIKYLRSLAEVLNYFGNLYRTRNVPGEWIIQLIPAFSKSMELERNQLSIASVIEQNELEIGEILLQSFAFKQNKGVDYAQELLVLKNCIRYPDNILAILTNHPNVFFADSLLILEARKDPDAFYNYAATPYALGNRIRSIQEPLVKLIAKMANIGTGRMYFPFLNQLYAGTLKWDTITSALADTSQQQYYKLLVKTQIENYAATQNGTKLLVNQVLTGKLKQKAIEIYINEINALHDVNSEQIRFKKIENLSPQELYYLCVLGEEEIYTSSYMGVYKRIMQKLKTSSTDSLFTLVHYNYYKKFIKMAAGFNTLDNFLAGMTVVKARDLMRSFVNNLEKEATLEDAVDVADSYASIYNSGLRDLILKQVQTNLKIAQSNNDVKAINIYNILNTLFLSLDTANHIDVSKELGINPVFYMPNKLLQDSTGRIIVQQFFYGDKDGQTVFKYFLANFNNGNWKIIDKPDWVEVTSIKGTPVTIYANKPLNEEENLDALAQEKLSSYLDEQGLFPTVYIHRGHSYYVSSTIHQLLPSAKVVLLGSCGGYHQLNDVLEISPQAHIIASKQIGSGTINQPMINIIGESLRQGKDLNWPQMWSNFEKLFSKDVYRKEKFEDYVPPHKNLGAIFIMAYKKQQV